MRSLGAARAAASARSAPLRPTAPQCRAAVSACAPQRRSGVPQHAPACNSARATARAQSHAAASARHRAAISAEPNTARHCAAVSCRSTLVRAIAPQLRAAAAARHRAALSCGSSILLRATAPAVSCCGFCAPQRCGLAARSCAPPRRSLVPQHAPARHRAANSSRSTLLHATAVQLCRSTLLRATARPARAAAKCWAPPRGKRVPLHAFARYCAAVLCRSTFMRATALQSRAAARSCALPRHNRALQQTPARHCAADPAEKEKKILRPLSCRSTLLRITAQQFRP